ncbi:MAG: zinc ribbon domain-containing protein [Clostridia bacterium]|nr:zinc ribbon domain-containing protein [Clostridia bacterium]
MKKLCSVLLILCLIFSLVACGDNEVITDNDTGEFCVECGEAISAKDNFCSFCGVKIDKSTDIETSQNEEPISTDLFQQEPVVQFDELKNIIDYNGYYDLFITNDGALYKIGNFSDGTKLRRVGEGIKFVKFSDGTIISDNNDVYIYNEDDFSVSLFNNGTGYVFNTKIPSDDYLNSVHIYIDTVNFVTAYIKGKEVFLYEEGSNTVTQKGAIHRFDDDEIVLYFIDGTVKTNKGYYCFKETINTSQYDDIPTTYMYSLEKITDVNEDIIFFKRFDCYYTDYRVDKNGNLFYEESY